MKGWTSCWLGAKLLSANPPVRIILETMSGDREEGCATGGSIADCASRIVVLALGL